jgi:hypothetical protein
VPRDTIRANQSHLNIALCVQAKGNGQGPAAAASTKPLSKVVAEWQGIFHALRRSMNQLLATLHQGKNETKKRV